jgi:hypothetical protein
MADSLLERLQRWSWGQAPLVREADIWREVDAAIAAPVGMRVQFREDFGEFPLARMPAGLSGEVVGADGESIRVRLDQAQEQLAGWDNEFHFHRDTCGGDHAGEFRRACRVTYTPRR